MTVGRDSNGRFAKGWQGGPGRSPGARSKLAETALAMLGQDFAEHGKEVIETVRRTMPHVYLKVVAGLLPRQLLIERRDALADVSDEEFEQLGQVLHVMRAKTVKQLELVAGTEVTVEPEPKPQPVALPDTGNIDTSGVETVGEVVGSKR